MASGSENGRSTYTLFSDTDFTPDEERLIFKSSAQNETLTIVRDSALAESLFVIGLKGHTQPEQRRVRDDLKILKFILQGVTNFGYLYRTSEFERPGDRSLAFRYGPRLNARPTTYSVELQNALRGVTEWIYRVEIGRQFSCRTVQYYNDALVEYVTQALTDGRGLVHYENEPAVCGDCPVEAVSTSQRAHVDPVTQFVMEPKPNVRSLAVTASRGSDSLPGPYMVSFVNGLAPIYGSTLGKTGTHVQSCIYHCHSALGLAGAQLSPALFHESLLPGGSNTAAACGLYAQSPSPVQDPVKQRKAIYQTLWAYAQCVQSTGTPIINGFLKTFPSDSPDASITTPIVHLSSLRLLPSGSRASGRRAPGQLLVCLGQFNPTAAPDSAPYLYSDSSSELNKISAVLDTFKRAAPKAVAATGRPNGTAPVIDHIFSVCGNFGVIMFTSGLPDRVRARIDRASGSAIDEVSGAVNKYYLFLYTLQLYCVVDNKDVEFQGQRVDCLKLLGEFCKGCGCEMAVLGKLSRQRGIFWLDDEAPGSVDREAATERDAAFAINRDNRDKGVRREFSPEYPQEPGSRRHPIDWSMFPVTSTVETILSHPSVAGKSFAVRHMDRFGNGLVVQQQGVGPLDLPLSDYALTVELPTISRYSRHMLTDITPQKAREIYDAPRLWFSKKEDPTERWGYITAVGEQAYKMSVDPAIACKYAITEMFTNMMFGPKMNIRDTNISASVCWNKNSEFAPALENVMFSCKEFCGNLGVNLSFTSAASSTLESDFTPEAESHPGLNSITFTGKTKVQVTGNRVTPCLRQEETALLHISLNGKRVLAGSVFEHVFLSGEGSLPDIEPQEVLNLFHTAQTLVESNLIFSGHDISDGGLITCCIEMALAGQMGITIHLPDASDTPLEFLLSETPGAVIEVPGGYLNQVYDICSAFNCPCAQIGVVNKKSKQVVIFNGQRIIFNQSLDWLLTKWDSLTSDVFSDVAPDAQQLDFYRNDYGNNESNFKGELKYKCMMNLKLFSSPSHPCSVGILIFEGCPKQPSLAAALTSSGFQVFYVMAGEVRHENSFNCLSGLCVGGGSGSKCNITGIRCILARVLKSPGIRASIEKFQRRLDTFTFFCGELGVQLSAGLGITGTEDAGPRRGPPEHDFGTKLEIELEKNSSGLFESRWLNFHIPINAKSIMLSPLKGLILPCWVKGTHLGLRYNSDKTEYMLKQQGMLTLTYHGRTGNEWDFPRNYPRNPTGNSIAAGICSPDGRHLATLCDLSTAYSVWQWQYVPPKYSGMKTSPWALCFHAAYLWSLKNKGL